MRANSVQKRVDEKIKWMLDNPWRWLVWGSRQYPSTAPSAADGFERRFGRDGNGHYTLEMRYVMGNNEDAAAVFSACRAPYKGSHILVCQRVVGHTGAHVRELNAVETMRWGDDE